MAIKSIAGSYEVEVQLGTQEVCLIDFDLPEAKTDLRKIKLDTPLGEETFRGILAGSFSSPADDEGTRLIQIYDLMDGISTLREGIEAGEKGDKLKEKVSHLAHDEVAQGCLQSFLFLTEPLSRDKLLQMLGLFSRFLITKKESLPKATSQTRTAKESPRWDRVVKQNQSVLITDEPTQDIDVNPLDEESLEETEPIETDWHEGGGGEIEPAGSDIDSDDDAIDSSETPD